MFFKITLCLNANRVVNRRIHVLNVQVYRRLIMNFAALFFLALASLAFFAGLYWLLGLPGIIVFLLIAFIGYIFAVKTAGRAPRQYIDLDEDQEEN